MGGIVDHPDHYSGRVECIEAMEDIWGKEAVKIFCEMNAFKYLWRAERKNGVEDIQKAIWYLRKLVELEEEKAKENLAGLIGEVMETYVE